MRGTQKFNLRFPEKPFTQLTPPILVHVIDKGEGQAFAVIDYGPVLTYCGAPAWQNVRKGTPLSAVTSCNLISGANTLSSAASAYLIQECRRTLLASDKMLLRTATKCSSALHMYESKVGQVKSGRLSRCAEASLSLQVITLQGFTQG